MESHTDSHRDSHTESHTDNHTDSHTDNHTDSHADNHTDSHTGSYRDRYLHTHGDTYTQQPMVTLRVPYLARYALMGLPCSCSFGVAFLGHPLSSFFLALSFPALLTLTPLYLPHSIPHHLCSIFLPLPLLLTFFLPSLSLSSHTPSPSPSESNCCHPSTRLSSCSCCIQQQWEQTGHGLNNSEHNMLHVM